MDLCPDFKQLAYQLTHIELDRLSHVGPDEFLDNKFARDILKTNNINDINSDRYSTNLNETLIKNPNQLKQELHDYVQDQIYIDKTLKRTYLKSTSNLKAYELWINRLYYFVSNEIVKLIDDSKKRVEIIEYFIDCADECFRIGNYNSSFLITKALKSSPVVTRLKKTVSINFNF